MLQGRVLMSLMYETIHRVCAKLGNRCANAPTAHLANHTRSVHCLIKKFWIVIYHNQIWTMIDWYCLRWFWLDDGIDWYRCNDWLMSLKHVNKLFIVQLYNCSPSARRWQVDRLIDWIMFYAVLAIFQPYNGGGRWQLVFFRNISNYTLLQNGGNILNKLTSIININLAHGVHFLFISIELHTCN